MTAANFDFSNYQTVDVLNEDEVKSVLKSDFIAPRGTIEYNWARLCSLCYALRVRRQSNAIDIDSRFLDSYDEDITALYTTRAMLEPQVEEFRKNPSNQNMRRALRSKIQDALQRLYFYIGCSSRLRGGRSQEIDRRLSDFGFELSPVREPPSQNDLMIVGLAVMATGVFVICFIASELVRYRLWTPSPYFPTSPFDPFIWAISAALAHGAAIFTADKVRSRLINQKRWFDIGPEGPRLIANYVRVGFCCAAVGYIVLLIFAVAMQNTPTWDMAKGAAAYALMPATTGAFYVVHLDNAKLGLRPRNRLLEVAPQALVTGLMGFVASEIWVRLGATQSSGNDFVILVSIMGVVVGASLAWYIPKNAAHRDYDPFEDILSQRRQAVRDLAHATFADDAEADRWFSTAIASLQNKSPAAALSDARNFEEVLRLLARAGQQ